jgi:hypothetical protein
MKQPRIAGQFVAGEPWSPESVGERLTPFFAGRTPFRDAYAVDLLSDYWRYGPDGPPSEDR